MRPINLFFGVIIFVVQMTSNNIHANSVEINANSPSEYVVKKGDTLWDIAGVFLKSPWAWPEIWEKNSQIKNPHLIYPNDVIYLIYVDGQPVLTKNKKGVIKLSPSIRSGGNSPIKTIPDSALRSFIHDHRVVEAERISNMPYILSGAGLSTLIARGDEVFIRGVLDEDFNEFDVYRMGDTYDSKHGLDSINTEIVKVATLRVKSINGDINKAQVVSANDLVRQGDIVVRHNALELKPIYYLASPPVETEGRVIAAANDSYKVAKYDSIVVDLGIDDGISAGHLFDIVDVPVSVKDPRTKEVIKISDQVIGKVMIVNVFDNVSYGIVLASEKIVPVGAVIK